MLMTSVIMLSAFYAGSQFTHKSIMLNFVMLRVIMLNVVMLNVLAPEVNGSGKQYGLLHHNNYDRKRF